MTGSGWRDVTFGDVASLEYGKSLPAAKRNEGPIPVYGSNGTIGYHDEALVSGPGIVVGRKGSVGAVGWVEHDFWPIDTTYYVEAKKPCDARWLYYAVSSLGLDKLNEATGVPGLNRGTAARARLPLPPIPVQQKISAILSSVDDAIEKTQAVIDEVQVVKRGLMQELLARGLPGRHTLFKQTEIGEIPKEWQLVRLGDVGTWSSGGTPSRRNQDYWTGAIPWVSGKDMKRARLDDALEHVSIDAIGNGTRITPRGSILIVVRGMILAHTFPVALTLTEVTFNQDLKALVPDERYAPEFLLYWLEYREGSILSLVDTASHGTKRLATTMLFAEPVPCPGREEQERISQLLRSNDSYRSVAVANLEGLAAVKQALMSVLLTGELRVSPDTEAA